jgi:hypothetical protein
MTPFLQLRFWWRTGTPVARLASGTAIAIVVALAAYLLVPTTDGDADVAAVGLGAAAEGTATGDGTPTAGPAAAPDAGAPEVATGTAAAPGSVPAGGAPASGAATVSEGTAAAGDGCVSAPSGTPGITNSTITVAGVVLDLAGPIGNSAAGFAAAEDLERMIDAVVADVNARGGVQCRKLQMKYYRANPLSQDQQRSVCLQVAQDKPFLGIDMAGFATNNAHNCLPQQKVPFLAITAVDAGDLERFAPYLATINGESGAIGRNAARALGQVGFLDPAKGFKKLGLLLDDCTPVPVRAFEAELARQGISGPKVSRYEFPCPTGFASPSQMSQAVTQHRLDGVTHVVPITGSGSFNTYTNIADGQRFKPKYGIVDTGNIIVTQTGALKANAANFDDNNIAVTITRYGQNTTPGLPVDPATQRCQQVLAKAGFGPDAVYSKGGGFLCSEVYGLVAAFKGAQALSREAALQGFARAGAVQLAFPLSDVTFRPGKLFGGDTWWPMSYQGGCGCWRVLDPNRKPAL